MLSLKSVARGLAVLVLFGQSLFVHADDDELAVDKVAGPISVMVLGSGGPIAVPTGRASAGYLVFIEGKPRILMDAGGGTYARIAESGVNIADLDIMLLSHLHLDHTGDIPAIVKTLYFHNNLLGKGRTAANPIRMWGPRMNGVPFPAPPFPTGVPQYPDTTDYLARHFDLPDGTDRYLRAFAPGISGGLSQFAYTATDLNSAVPGATVEHILTTPDGVEIAAIAVDHGPVPAVAFRITYKGYVVAYSGDTRSTGPNMATIADNADLLIYDTAITDTLPPNPLFHVLHTSPTRMGEVAVASGAKTLVLSHITPVTETRLNEVKSVVRAQGYEGEIKVARDLKVYNLGVRKHHKGHDHDD